MDNLKPPFTNPVVSVLDQQVAKSVKTTKRSFLYSLPNVPYYFSVFLFFLALDDVSFAYAKIP